MSDENKNPSELSPEELLDMSGGVGANLTSEIRLKQSNPDPFGTGGGSQVPQPGGGGGGQPIQVGNPERSK